MIEPLMSEGGVIFFDGMEARRLQFAASMSARIQIAASSGPPLARGTRPYPARRYQKQEQICGIESGSCAHFTRTSRYR